MCCGKTPEKSPKSGPKLAIPLYIFARNNGTYRSLLQMFVFFLNFVFFLVVYAFILYSLSLFDVTV